MPDRCEACGEELLGAVNRCWKCGAAAPVLATPFEKTSTNSPFAKDAPPREAPARDYDRQSLIVGTAYGSLAIGLFALTLSWWLPHAIVPSVIGLSCGAWSYSQRRNWIACVGILMCLLALGWSGILTYRGIYDWYDLNFGEDMF